MNKLSNSIWAEDKTDINLYAGMEKVADVPDFGGVTTVELLLRENV